MTGPNVALLRETMDAVLAHQDQWDQAYWIRETECGTSYCFAGWVAALDGYTQTVRSSDLARRKALAGNASGETVVIRDHASERLGLTDEQAYDLFSAGNTLADLKRIVDDLCDGVP